MITIITKEGCSMGIFYKLLNALEIKKSTPDIALELFSTLGIGGGRELSSRAKRILSRCSHRTDVLKEMISLCPNPSSPKELYIVSTAYVWLGASYRKEAIKYLSRYIDAGAFWNGLPSDNINLFGYEENQRDLNVAKTYFDLGQCYEKEYMFDEAIVAYTKAYDHNPYFAYYTTCIANAYVKKGDYDTALNVLYEAKQSKYYREYTYITCDSAMHINTDFINIIDATIIDINDKMKRGYKYRPRPNHPLRQ